MNNDFIRIVLYVERRRLIGRRTLLLSVFLIYFVSIFPTPLHRREVCAFECEGFVIQGYSNVKSFHIYCRTAEYKMLNNRIFKKVLCSSGT